MRRQKKHRHQVGKFFLKPPDHKYATWGISWVEKVGKHNRTKRVSTGHPLEEEEAAYQRLAQYALSHSEEQSADALTDQPVALILAWHWENYGRKLIAYDTVELAKDNALDCWKAAMVSELTAPKQLLFIKMGRTRGWADSTIVRRLNCVWTAFRVAAACHQLKAAVIPPRLPRRLWPPRDQPVTRRSTDPSKRMLKLEELAAIFDAAYGREHRVRYLILQLGTGGRTEAVTRVSRAQVDFERNVLDLNPPGRVQNNKYYPTVPMCPTLRGWAESWGAEEAYQGRYLHRRGRPIATANFIRKTIAEAKVKNCTPYTFRHTISSWLAFEGVDRWERKRFLGHKRPDGGSTDDYTHYDPAYLRSAAEAIERLFHLIAPLTRVNILRREYEDQSPPETAFADALAFLEGPNSIRLVSGGGEKTSAQKGSQALSVATPSPQGAAT